MKNMNSYLIEEARGFANFDTWLNWSAELLAVQDKIINAKSCGFDGLLDVYRHAHTYPRKSKKRGMPL